MRKPFGGFKFGATEAIRFLNIKDIEYLDEDSKPILCKCGKKAYHELCFLSATLYLCKDCNVKRKVSADEMV